MSLKHYRRQAFSLILLACLAACGGGGNSSQSGDANTSSMAVSGSAAKGFLIGAEVTLYPVSNGVRGTAIARTQTDENGNYSFTGIKAFSGPAIIEVKTQAGSMMIDELNGKMAAPQGLVLRAAVADISSMAEVHLTPFSEMAASAVESSGQRSAAAITVANDAVEREYLGDIPLLETRPMKSEEFAGSKSENQRTLTKALTALAVAAQKSDATDEKNNKCAESDYGNRIKCTLRGVSKGIRLNADATSATATQAWVDVMSKGLTRINKGEVEISNSDGKSRKRSDLAVGADKLAFESRFGQDSGPNDDRGNPPTPGTAQAIQTARTMLADFFKFQGNLDPDSAQRNDPALKTVQEPEQLTAPARSVLFMSSLIHASRIANGEITSAALSGTRCTKLTNTSARCTSTSWIGNHGYGDMILEVSRNGDNFNWKSRSQQTQCSTGGARVCKTGDPSGVLSGTVTAVRANNKLATLTAIGNIMGLGDSDPWVGKVKLLIQISEGYNDKGLFSAPIPITGSVEVLNNMNQLGAPDVTAPLLFQLNFQQGSTITLTPAGEALQAARLNLITTTQPQKYTLEGKLSLADFVVRSRNGKDDRVPGTLDFQGSVAQNGSPSTRFVGAQSVVFSNLRSFDPTQPETAVNFLKSITKTSGTADLRNGVGVDLSAETRLIQPDLGNMKSDFLFREAGGSKRFKTESTFNPRNDDANFTIQSDNSIKIVLTEKNGKESGAIYNGTNQIGSIESSGESGTATFVDGTTLTLKASRLK